VIPRSPKKSEELYDGRSAVEVANARLKEIWGSDKGNISGGARIHGPCSSVMIMHATFAKLLAAATRHGVFNQTRISIFSEALRGPPAD
jgi:hypothetical protein